MADDEQTIRLELPSSFEMLDLVELLSDRVAGILGLDEDASHWIGVAVRESVINAIKHGNHEDRQKHVVVEFNVAPGHPPPELIVAIMDEGEGFDPEAVADPLDPENILKSSGRGLFFMKSFMDEVSVSRRPEGGTAVRMIKKLA